MLVRSTQACPLQARFPAIERRCVPGHRDAARPSITALRVGPKTAGEGLAQSGLVDLTNPGGQGHRSIMSQLSTDG